MTLRAVVLDLDGTVVDTVPLIIDSYQHTFRTVLGSERDPAWIRSTIGTPLQTVLEEVDAAHAEDMLAVYLEHNLARVHTCPLCPGIGELVTGLRERGIAVGIATAKRRASAEATLAACAPGLALPALACFEDTAAHKPEPAPILHALELLDLPAAEAAYVGDAPVDVLAARAAGALAVAVASGAGSRDDLAAAGPDHLLDRVDELLALLPA